MNENGTGLYLERKDYRNELELSQKYTSVYIQQTKFLRKLFEVSKSRNETACMCRTISDCTKNKNYCLGVWLLSVQCTFFSFQNETRNYCEYKLSPSYHRHAIFGKHSNKFFTVRFNIIHNMHAKKLFFLWTFFRLLSLQIFVTLELYFVSKFFSRI